MAALLKQPSTVVGDGYSGDITVSSSPPGLIDFRFNYIVFHPTCSGVGKTVQAFDIVEYKASYRGGLSARNTLSPLSTSA